MIVSVRNTAGVLFSMSGTAPDVRIAWDWDSRNEL